MCDYSLMGLPNRLATEGENLVVHHYSTGSLGLGPKVAPPQGIWATLKAAFRPGPVPVVCVPPGARLLLRDIPVHIQLELGVSPEEEVVFTQTGSLENSHRDTIRFRNTEEILFQRLSVGQRVRVLDLSSAETPEPVLEHRLQLPIQPGFRW
jgi:hypothetical protein